MPNPATLPAGNEAPSQQSAEVAVVRNPFVRAAQETTQPFDDRTTQIGASPVRIGPISVPSQGFLRHIVLDVTTTGGSGGSAAGRPDAPWIALDAISLEDTNGRPIVGPLNGYDLYLINKWGGFVHSGNPDPATYPSFSAINATTGQFSFKLRIPIEITSRDGLGALPNLTSAATYKLNYTVSASTVIYSTPPATTLPSINVKAYMEVWSQPAQSDPMGIMNETAPPALGTTGFWSKQAFQIQPGEQRVTFTRMGNMIRNWIMVFYDDSSPAARISTEFPSSWRVEWDNKILTTTTQRLQADVARERYNLTLDTGVFVMDFTHDADGTPGNENRHLWIPTVSGTRFELIGTFTGSGGMLYILTNDVAVRGSVKLDSGMAN